MRRQPFLEGECRITRETPDQQEVHDLLRQADARPASLYPAESRFGSPVDALLRLDMRFFVARVSRVALGCSGYAVEPGGWAEVKRVFVTQEARGRGVGRALLHAIERAAQAEGVTCLRLETGVKSVEAVSLYVRLGFIERGPFGAYGPDPLSLFMEKRLIEGAAADTVRTARHTCCQAATAVTPCSKSANVVRASALSSARSAVPNASPSTA